MIRVNTDKLSLFISGSGLFEFLLVCIPVVPTSGASLPFVLALLHACRYRCMHKINIAGWKSDSCCMGLF